jgi:hypothetical protein
MTTKCLPRSEKNQPKISLFMTSEKENHWSEDETDTSTTTEANEPIEVNQELVETIIIVCRSRLPAHDVQLYGPYVMVMRPTGTHITF